MDRGAWQTIVHRVRKSWTRLSDYTFTFIDTECLTCLEQQAHGLKIHSYFVKPRMFLCFSVTKVSLLTLTNNI